MRSALEWVASSPWCYFTLIFLVCMAIRLNQLHQLTRVYPDYLAPTGEREDEAIAISLYSTGEFADPYLIPTGPTAHLAPVNPFIISLIYRLFGVTTQAGNAGAIFVVIIASALYAMLPWISERLGTGRVAGLVGGMIGAIGGLEKSIDARFSGNGEYLTSLVLGLLILAFLHRWKGKGDGWAGSLLLGVATGAAFHLQPALLPVVLGFMLFEVWWLKKPRKWVFTGVMALGILIACIPWGWRNYQAFNATFFIRSNLGLELRMGNNDRALATFEEMDAMSTHYQHPRVNFVQARSVLDLGEYQYMLQARDEALDWIKSHFSRFLWLTGQRMLNLWVGPPYLLKYFTDVFRFTVLAMVGLCMALPCIKPPQRAALIIPLLTYPLIYYIVAYMPRYRIPINWILYILAGAVVWKLIGGSLGSDKAASSPPGNPK